MKISEDFEFEEPKEPEVYLEQNGYIQYANRKFYKRIEFQEGKEGIIVELDMLTCLDTIGALHLLALTPNRSVWHYEVRAVFVRQYAPDFHIQYKVKDLSELSLLEHELKTMYNLFCQQDNNFKKD